MDLRPTGDHELLRRTVREFAEAEIRPHVREWDEAQKFPAALLTKMAGLGLMGIRFPAAFGGAGMSAVEYCIAIEELARVDPAVALSVAAHNGLCSSHLYLFGTEEQKQRYLVPLVKGETLGAWGLTEAGAGSDAAAMRTEAKRTADGWLITGSKQFITHGKIGGILVAMAVTDRAKGRHGISAFVIPRGTPGLRAGKKEDKLGMRASDTSEVIFQDCRVPADAVVGVEGQGFINTLQVLDTGRIGIAALAVGLAQGAFEGRAELCQRAPAVRPADRQLPGDPVEARGHGLRDRGRASSDVSRGVDEGHGRRRGPRASRPWPSCTRARSRCGPPKRASRFTAGTAS